MIYVKQNDTRPPAYAALRRGTTPVVLTTATSVTFKMTRLGRVDKKVDAAATILNADTGEVEYRWFSSDTDESGQYAAEWEILWNDGTVETFPTIDFDYVLITDDLDGNA